MGRCLTLGCLLTLGGCHLIFPFNPDAPPVLDDAGLDVAVDRDTGQDDHDGPWSKEASVTPDGPKGCTPPGHKVLTMRSHLAGDWSVALEPGTTYKQLTVMGAVSLEAAASVDYDQNNHQVAGFIVSRAFTGSVDEVSDAMVQSIKGVASVQLISGGRATKTHDGHNAVLETTFRVSSSATTPSALRNTFLTTVLMKNTVTGLPGPWGATSTSFTLRVSTVLRGGGRAIFLGAVTATAADADSARLTRVIATNLTDATGLARHGRPTIYLCQVKMIQQPLAPVDIIWVMDESGSMSSKRYSIASSAASFFALAKSNGLDFRMGVTNVCAPGKPGSCLQGKFCSHATAASADMGGVDRFLLPAEQSLFEACIKNPPGAEFGTEHGLDAARKAVELHLPRTTGSASKIRPEARIVIITATDEVPNELNSAISGEHKACTLSSPTQAKVDLVTKTYIDYLGGRTDPQAAVSAYHVIGGVCSGSCGADVAHGYKELTAALGGLHQDVCPANLGPSITKIISAIKTTAGGLKPNVPPISASLRLALNGQIIPRSLKDGFNYNPLQGLIVFVGATALKTGDTVKLSYSRWQ